MARQRALHGGSDGGACAGGQPRRAMLHTPCAAQTDLINASALPLNIWWVPPASLSMSPTQMQAINHTQERRRKVKRRGLPRFFKVRRGVEARCRSTE